eukprot:TRINITY_DN2471_c0_g1_i1.p1 TRINITY_DN2471_c0_g1~~TRINITY_DN2471_c0_g1_i1.p1  ORF type:complete len:408 (-),score=96.85 TRINITY_DN2471_c0_g1_i1:19-1242(-)
MEAEGRRIYLQGLLKEAEGFRSEAIALYKKAYKLDPELEFNAQDTIEVDGVIYDMKGQPIDKPVLPEDAGVVENEDDPYLSEEQRSSLSRWKHSLDYSFTQDQLKFLEENGYLVIKNLFSADVCDQMVHEISSRAEKLDGIKQNDPKTWEEVRMNLGFFDIWHNPTYYKIRQDPKLYSIFAQLLKNPKLTCSLDRVCMKPPKWIEKEVVDGKIERIEFTQPSKFGIHNDMNLWFLEESGYQGGLCLSSCPVGGGGFVCVPGYHKLEKIRKYRHDFIEGRLGTTTIPPPKESKFNWYEDREVCEKAIEIPMEKGDFVVWSTRLPHSNALNTTNHWRFHCYVRYVPSDEYVSYTQRVCDSVTSFEKPVVFSTGNSTGSMHSTWECDLSEGENIEITELGKNLFGVLSWK